MDMGTAEKRKKIKKYIDEADDRIVNMVFSMLEADKEKDWWDELPEEVQAGIDRAVAELDAGKGIPHEQVMKKYKKWLPK
jgi:predicted transcriptional regulator